MAEQERRGPKPGLLVATGALGLFGSALALLWIERTPIARSYVDDALEARGVSGSYEITRFGIRSQTLEHIRIGDPAHPDLTARWAKLYLAVGLTGPRVAAIEARGVRIRGRLVRGKVSLGAIDRLLPPPSGAPFALPDLDVDLRDARMRLDTPAGPVGLAIEGQGNLADGFDGRLAAVMREARLSGCRVERATAFINIAITRRNPAIDGPLRLAKLECAGSGVAVAGLQAAVDVNLNEALTAWKGTAVIDSGPAQAGAGMVNMLGGRIGFDGTTAGVRGSVALFANGLASPSLDAHRATIDGRYGIRFAGTRASMIGEAQLTGATARPHTLRPMRVALASTSGSPLGPIGSAIGDAIARAGSGFAARGTMLLVSGPRGGAVRFERLDVESASGARIAVRGGPGRGGLTHYWTQGVTRIDGDLQMAGGGLPGVRLSLRQPWAGAPMQGSAIVDPYAAGDSRIALAPVRFGPGGGGRTRFATRVTLDGPLGDGRVEGLTLPLSGVLGAYGSFRLNDRCEPLDFAALRVAGMALGRTRLPLCPSGGALLARAPGEPLTGGAHIAGPRLTGRVGASPLAIQARSLGVEVGRPGFIADTLAVRLGAAPGLSRLDVQRLAGTLDRGGIGGRFAGLSGNIGNVPLLLSRGEGDWRLAGGALALNGSLQVADAAPDPRFRPLVSNDVNLRLANGIVTAAGWLHEPASGARVTQVALRHDLRSGRGNALLDVPGIEFNPGFQPEALTRLSLGVVANVVGKLAGRGEIRWSPAGVTSTGTFRTNSMDLAAAFGPVSRLKGEIHFSDLLGLETPPGQVATLGEVNPGIAVNDGVLRYQLLPGQHLKIEGAIWPFSGGELTLDETIIDFSQPSARHLTFRVVGMDAAQFVQQFNFKNISVTGTFDGVIPMVFDAQGGRIVGGRLVVRRGGGKLAYVGEVSNADLGTFGKLAFDALKSIRYQSLAIELNGSLDGEIISRVLFTGTNEAPPEVKKKKSGGLLGQFTGLPFKFNITIRAPFRSLLNSAQSLTDPRGLISRSIGAEVELPGSVPEQPEPAVQPK